MAKPDNLDDLFVRARAEFDGRAWVAAIELLMSVIRIDPDYPGAQELLGAAQKRQAAHGEYLFGLGYYNKRDWIQAIERLDAAIRDDPGHVDAQAKLEKAKRQRDIERLLSEADKYRRSYHWDSVVTALKGVLALDPDLEDVRQMLADALAKAAERHFEGRRWRAAQQFLEELQELQEVDQLRLNLDVGSMQTEIRRQLDLDELHQQAQEHERAHEWSKARDLYDQIYREAPSHNDVVDRLAYCKRKIEAESQGDGPNRTLGFLLLGFAIAAASVVASARSLQCLLTYRTTDALITLMIFLIGGLAFAFADLPSDILKALRRILGGATCPLLFFVMWMILSPPPLREDCSSILPVVLTPSGEANVSTPSQTFTKTRTPSSVPTLTSAATLAATRIPPATSTPSPTVTPTATLSPYFDWVDHLTIPEWTAFAPGTPLTVSWVLKSVNSSQWSAGSKLVFVRGDKMGGPDELEILSLPISAGVFTVSVSLVAPTSEGEYQGVWQVQDADGTSISDELNARIVVYQPVPPAPPPFPLANFTWLDIFGCGVTFHWDWDVELAKDEYFAVRVGIGTPGHSKSWTKETQYSCSLEPGEYVWNVAICRGDPAEGVCDELAVTDGGTFQVNCQPPPPP